MPPTAPGTPDKKPSAADQRKQAAAQRLVSLDQFRGYTVIGMLLVNYFGGYQVCPQVWKHTHDYCSYADTIMPQFLFAVGFAMRLTFGRRMAKQGSTAAYARMAKRLLGLVLVALVIHTGPRIASWSQLTEIGFPDMFFEPFKRSWFQTLMHIAVTSLWILPVIHASHRVRIAWMVGSAVAHVVLSYLFNFVWCNTSPNAIDGGPLGFLTWTIPALMGSLVCDWFVPSAETGSAAGAADTPSRGPVATGLRWGFALMLLGWVFSCGTRWYDDAAPLAAAGSDSRLAAHPVVPTAAEFSAKASQSAGIADWLAEPPFVKPPAERKWNYWMMSQRAGTLSYLTFAAGFAVVVFVGFYVACDQWGWHLPVFRTFGTNALLAYIMHDLVSDAVKPFFPSDSPGWYAYLGLAIFYLVNWVFLRSLEKQDIYLRV